MNSSDVMLCSRSGSVTPVIMMLLALFLLAVLLLFDQFQESVLARRGQAAAQAVAVGMVSSLYPLNGTALAGHDQDGSWKRWDALARGNGLSEPNFFPLDPTGVNTFPFGVEVTVVSREPGVDAITVQAQGVPAGRIRAGRLHAQRPGGVYPLGCLPLGLRVRAWIERPSASDELVVTTSGRDADAMFVQFVNPTAMPVDYLRFLKSATRVDPSGVAPPSVEVGDVLTRERSGPVLLAELAEVGALGRVQVIPLLRAGEVVGFGLVRILEVDVRSTPPVLRLATASSAVVPGALASLRPQANPIMIELRDLPRGSVLRPQVEFL